MSRTGQLRGLRLGFAGLGLLVLLGSGCSPTRLVNVWRDPSVGGLELDRMLVVAVRKNNADRRMWEDAFAEELAERGVAATPSYRLYPQAPPDTQQVRDALQNGDSDFNGVLTAYPLLPRLEADYVPPRVTVEPAISYSPFLGRYCRHWYHVHDPGYIDVRKIRRYEVDVYITDGELEQMVWTGTAEINGGLTRENIRNSAAGTVAERLADSRIIPGRV